MQPTVLASLCLIGVDSCFVEPEATATGGAAELLISAYMTALAGLAVLLSPLRGEAAISVCMELLLLLPKSPSILLLMAMTVPFRMIAAGNRAKRVSYGSRKGEFN
jgi:hypothetical protein